MLKILQKLSDTEREILICYLNNDGCAGLYECIHNAVYNTTLRREQREKLQKELNRDKNKFRQILNEKTSADKKNKTLKKIGGKVGIVLETVLPLLEKFVEDRKKT